MKPHRELITKILQNLIELWDFEFLINLNENDIRILDYLNTNFPKLEDLIESPDFNIRLSRGVELGKEGEVIFCAICQKYYPLPNIKLKCPDPICNLRFSIDKFEFSLASWTAAVLIASV